MNKDFFKNRPLSWSAVNTFLYDKEEWYQRYIKGVKSVPNDRMSFGKVFGKAIEDRKPLANVVIYKEVEYPLKARIFGIDLTGFIDTYEPHTAFREYKTSVSLWDRNKAIGHGQLKFYALCLYLMHKVKPEDLTIHLDCIQTEETMDDVRLVVPHTMVSHEVKLTMKDIMEFALLIKNTVAEMKSYTQEHD